MQDTYMIGDNVTFSSTYGTMCTEDYGACGLVLDSSHQSWLLFTHVLLDVTIARVHSKIFLHEWTSTETICLLTVGNEQNRFGQFPKHSEMKGSFVA